MSFLSSVVPKTAPREVNRSRLSTSRSRPNPSSIPVMEGGVYGWWMGIPLLAVRMFRRGSQDDSRALGSGLATAKRRLAVHRLGVVGQATEGV